MATGDVQVRIKNVMNERIALETRLQKEPGELSESAAKAYDGQYAALQRQLAPLFSGADDDEQRIAIMLEIMRMLENRLVYLQNFIVDPTSDNRVLAQVVTRFLDDMGQRSGSIISPLEATYYRGVASLYSGDQRGARESFSAACASEESDEANDIKYKSYVILGHLSHGDHDYAAARDLHDQSMRYTVNGNVTAQALALKALNTYALQDLDEALRLFEEALRLFDPEQPFFNSYFYRNALLFCGAIYFDRRQYKEAEERYSMVVESVDPGSYDHFDALSHLARIQYLQGRYEESAETFEKALQLHRLAENEYIIDTWFWLARCHLKREDRQKARTYLEKIAASDVRYQKRPQALELLGRIA